METLSDHRYIRFDISAEVSTSIRTAHCPESRGPVTSMGTRMSRQRYPNQSFSRVGLAKLSSQAPGYRREGGLVPGCNVANLRRVNASDPRSASAASPGVLMDGQARRITDVWPSVASTPDTRGGDSATPKPKLTCRRRTVTPRRLCKWRLKRSRTGHGKNF